MRTLRIAELDFCLELDSYIGELTKIPDLKLDRYSIAVETAEGKIHPKILAMFRATPPKEGGLNFPIATFVEGDRSIQVSGMKDVMILMKGLSPSYATTRTLKRADSARLPMPKAKTLKNLVSQTQGKV